MTMSAGEFKRFLGKKSFRKIIFNTTRFADRSLVLLPVSFSMELDSMYIDQSPPAITIKGASGSVCFESVKSIDVSEDEEVGEIWVDLTCFSCGRPYIFRMVIC